MSKRKFDIAEWEEKLKNGADINARDNDGDTPLFMAAYGNKNPKVIKTLLEYGADVNIRDDSGKTPLNYAVKYNAEDKIFEILLASGANIENENEMVKSAVVAFEKRQKIRKTSAT